MTRTPPTEDATASGEWPGGQCGNALVLASNAPVARRTLASVTGVDPAASNVIAVAYDDDAETWLDAWYEEFGAPTADVAVVSPGEFARSAAATQTTHSLPGLGIVDAIGDPDDLAVVGCRLREHLAERESHPQETLVSFESVDALLDRFGLRTTFRFLHLVCHEASRVDATGWFYLDPTTFDEVTVRTLAPLFDAVVERRDGEWTADRA